VEFKVIPLVFTWPAARCRRAAGSKLTGLRLQPPRELAQTRVGRSIEMDRCVGLKHHVTRRCGPPGGERERPGRLARSSALGEDFLQAPGVGLDVGADLRGGAAGVAGADGGEDGLVLGEQRGGVLVLPVLH
jgi:hypothetical protein